MGLIVSVERNHCQSVGRLMGRASCACSLLDSGVVEAVDVQADLRAVVYHRHRHHRRYRGH